MTRKHCPMRLACIASIFLGIFLSGGMVDAQSVSYIKSSKEYLYGEGRGYTLKEADDAALADLVRKISVTIEGDFRSEERERASGDAVMSETDYTSIINTYSSATLANTERMVIKDEPDAEVFRYVKKTEIDRIFKARTDKVIEFVNNSQKALEKRQLDDALRYLYWGYCLTKSLRYPNEATFEVGGVKRLLITWIPYELESIMSDISLTASKCSETDYKLTALYKGEPIKSMDYTFFDGADYSGVYSIADGEGMIELRPGFAGKEVTVKVEYEFAGIAVSDREVEDVMKAQRKSLFRKSNIRVPLAATTFAGASNQNSAVQVSRELAMTEDTEKYIDKVLSVSNSLKKLNPESVRTSFTEGGWSDFCKILSYGAIMVNDDQSLNCFCSGSDIVCRGLSCSFKFGRDRVFNENLSFCFDQSGKISHVSLGIGKMAMNDILTKNKWGDEARKRLVSFLEDYRTAYAVKDIDYMETVFDDNAVIIVGNKVRRDVQSTDRTYVDNKYVKLTRYTKQEFIRRLRTSFAGKEYINLHFSDLDVIKLRPDADLYGIQLRQEYYSSNYGDVGYLYLLVDLTNPQRPVIHVRTWQEEPDPEFGIIGPGNF